MTLRLVAVVMLVSVVSCRQDSTKDGPFLLGTVLGTNENPDLEEASGLAASARYPGKFWAHNDSGNKPLIFLLDSRAQTLKTFTIAAKNRDWEDIAIGAWSDSTTVLFIGDTGDNQKKHKLNYIYCLVEPDTTEANETEALAPVDTLRFRYADGPRDAEALLFDPLTRNLYIVTKTEHEVRVYEITHPYPADTASLQPLLKLPIRHITAGDISRDGTEILIKSYHAVYYWKRQPGQSVLEAIKAEPIELPYEREPMGESVAWAPDGSGYYTLSETRGGERGRLMFYARAKADTAIRNP